MKAMTKEAPIVALEQIARIQKGSTITAKNAVKGEVPVIAGGMKPAYFHNESNREANVITVSASGAAGYVSFHPYPIYASDCITVESRDLGVVDQRYLYLALLSMQDHLYSLSRGTALQHVYAKDLKSLMIPVPHLEEQKRIVQALDDHLSRLDEVVAGLLGVETLLSSMKRSIFEKFGQRISHAPEFPILDLCDVYQPRTISVKDLVSDGTYPVYGANGQIGYYNEYNHEDSEVTVTCRGATCGTVNVIPEKSWITGNAMVVRPKSGQLSKDFLELYLRGLNYNKVITGTAQPQITRQSISSLRLPLPSLTDQVTAVTRSQEVLRKHSVLATLLEDCFRNLDVLRRALLHSAFEGKLIS
jgi:restriction endonuclease S subunit